MPTEAAITVSQLNRTRPDPAGTGYCAGSGSRARSPTCPGPPPAISISASRTTAAQVSAAWFRQRQRGPAIGFKNGDQVLAFGRVSLYEARGNYQLIVEQMEPAGEGVLKRRFEALKKKLLAEGLFDEDRKQALARPARGASASSHRRAARRSATFVSVLGRRFPAVPVIIYPAAVQGDAAPGELVAALQTAIRRERMRRADHRPRRRLARGPLGIQ